MLELQKKTALYCDLNEIQPASKYDEIIQVIENNNVENVLQHLVTYNTEDFLIQWLWDLAHGKITDEEFFQIWDIGVWHIIKQPRPHLTAIEHILEHLIPHTLYVIDEAAYISYHHIHGDVVIRDFISTLEKNSCILVVIAIG